jgi:hypothetical protein
MSLLRSSPSSRRSSAMACRPLSSIDSSVSAVDRRPAGSTRRSAAACTTMTLRLCAMTSCSSRAIRARSVSTARAARASWSRSSRSARSCWPEARCRCWCTIRPITKIRTKNNTAGNTLPMPWPASSPQISPPTNRHAETASPVRSARPSVRLARANNAVKIASAGSNGGWSLALNMARNQIPEPTVTRMRTAVGARNRQQSGTVTRSRNAAWTATGPRNVVLLPSEDRLPFCAMSTAPRARMASGISHQETADHSRSMRSIPARYARLRRPASARKWSAEQLPSARRGNRGLLSFLRPGERETGCGRKRCGPPDS